MAAFMMRLAAGSMGKEVMTSYTRASRRKRRAALACAPCQMLETVRHWSFVSDDRHVSRPSLRSGFFRHSCSLRCCGHGTRAMSESWRCEEATSASTQAALCHLKLRQAGDAAEVPVPHARYRQPLHRLAVCAIPIPAANTQEAHLPLPYTLHKLT